LEFPQREAAFSTDCFLRGHSADKIAADIEVPAVVLAKWHREAEREPELRDILSRVVAYRRHVLAIFDTLIGSERCCRGLSSSRFPQKNNRRKLALQRHTNTIQRKGKTRVCGEPACSRQGSFRGSVAFANLERSLDTLSRHNSEANKEAPVLKGRWPATGN